MMRRFGALISDGAAAVDPATFGVQSTAQRSGAEQQMMLGIDARIS